MPNHFIWQGDQDMHLDDPHIVHYQGIIIGLYGGNTSAGANKNEDGVFVWRAPDSSWEFVALMDAHNTAQSVDLVMKSLASIEHQIKACLSSSSVNTFDVLRELIIHTFTSREFLDQCSTITGETSCLICARKDGCIWWLNIGDCVLYLFHDELQKMGQFALNQRSFYEWIGNQSAFNQGMPCYSCGIRELRAGKNMILMTTDGLLEFGDRPYEEPSRLYDGLRTQFQSSLEHCIQQFLTDVHSGKGRDSATIVSWTIDNALPGCYPSDQK